MIRRSDITRLKGLDAQLAAFGADSHRYELGEPLAERNLEHSESAGKFRFPPSYRDYLAQVGNGGAGPFYGLFPFGFHDHNHGLVAYDRGGLVGRLDQPCVLTGYWNLPEAELAFPSLPPDLDGESEERLVAEYDRRLESTYWHPSLMNGCLPLCHRGCALRSWLVVTGNEPGKVWNDDRADEGGIYPLLSDAGEPLDFAEWMQIWLDDPFGYTGRLNRRNG